MFHCTGSNLSSHLQTKPSVVCCLEDVKASLGKNEEVVKGMCMWLRKRRENEVQVAHKNAINTGVPKGQIVGKYAYM